VKELTYKKEGYVANAILKCSVRAKADNLVYEGLVGMFLNKFSKRIPTFLKTYGIYEYADKTFYEEMLTNKTVDEKELTNDKLKKLDLTNEINFRNACDNSQYLAVLIQYLKGVTSLRNNFKSDEKFRNYDLTGVLFQVYYTLSVLQDDFTHYDLHAENVLLYEPVKGSFIEYHYHLYDGIVSFKSSYIAKIIDYGRSYFKGDTRYSSKKILDKVNDDCLNPQYEGFQWLIVDSNQRNSYISSKINNHSHDLRLLNYLKEKNLPVPSEISDMLSKVVFDDPNGTQPRDYTNNYTDCKRKICDVTDAYLALRNILKTPDYQVRNDVFYRTSKKLGDLHIYMEGEKEMEYFPTI
jgi:hypothetical protein